MAALRCRGGGQGGGHLLLVEVGCCSFVVTFCGIGCLDVGAKSVVFAKDWGAGCEDAECEEVAKPDFGSLNVRTALAVDGYNC